jgi:hypothetical protein
MRFLINLLTGDTLTQTSDTTLTDTQGNVWNKAGSTWHDSHGNTIQSLDNKMSMKQDGSLFSSWGDDHDF